MCHYWFFFGTLELFRQCGIIGFSIGLWNCSDSVALFVLLLNFGTVPRVWHYWFFIFLLDFGTVPTVWYYLFFYWTLELIRQCGIIGFSMGIWNCSDSVPLFVLLLNFGTVPRVWHY